MNAIPSTPQPFGVSTRFIVVLFLVTGSLSYFLGRYPCSDDDIVHYMIAKDAAHEASFLIDIWGRPGFTTLHVLPAQLSYEACRLTNWLFSLGAGLLIALRCRTLHPMGFALGFAFTVFQGVFFRLSCSVLTETVYAFFLALGIYLFYRQRWALASLAFSWTAITRLEGIPLLAIIALAFILEERKSRLSSEGQGIGWTRRAFHIVLLGAFPLLWNLLLFAHGGWKEPLALLTQNVFIDAPDNAYGSGSPFKFVLSSWMIHGPILAVFVFFGFRPMWRRGESLEPLFVLGFYVLQSTLWAGGFFRTGGYVRFFASMAPSASVLAVYGALWIQERWPHLLRGRRLSTAIVLSALFALGYHLVKQSSLDQNYKAQKAAVEDLRRLGGFDPSGLDSTKRLICTSPYALMMLGLTPWSEDSLAYASMDAIRNASEGTYILYSGYRPSPGDEIPIAELYQPEDRRRAFEARDRGENWVHLLEETVPMVREVADHSILTRFWNDVEDELWPYYVKLFVRTDVAFPPH